MFAKCGGGGHERSSSESRPYNHVASSLLWRRVSSLLCQYYTHQIHTGHQWDTADWTTLTNCLCSSLIFSQLFTSVSIWIFPEPSDLVCLRFISDAFNVSQDPNFSNLQFLLLYSPDMWTEPKSSIEVGCTGQMESLVFSINEMKWCKQTFMFVKMLWIITQVLWGNPNRKFSCVFSFGAEMVEVERTN